MVALAWSGGKDSALALHVLLGERATRPTAFLTTVNEDHGRVTMDGARRELVKAQADAARVPLVENPIPARCPNDVYEARRASADRLDPPTNRIDLGTLKDRLGLERHPRTLTGLRARIATKLLGLAAGVWLVKRTARTVGRTASSPGPS